MHPFPRRSRAIALCAVVVLAVIATALPATGARRPAPLLPNGTFDRSLRGWTLSEPQAYCGGAQYIAWVKTRTTGGTPVVDGGAAWLNACGGTPKPSIRQSIPVAVGTTYRLTGRFYVEGQQGDGNFAVQVDDVGVTYQVGSTDANGWKSFSHDFVPTAVSVTLRFLGEMGGDHSVYVDDLVVTALPAP